MLHISSQSVNIFKNKHEQVFPVYTNAFDIKDEVRSLLNHVNDETFIF